MKVLNIVTKCLNGDWLKLALELSFQENNIKKITAELVWLLLEGFIVHKFNIFL